jgi:serine/threonine protein kinase
LTLSSGTRLGPYEIVAPLGVGGMGEVYRATDTNLKRQIAVKVLPASVASDPERLARFQREAEILAALNYPNIAHIHGLERAGGTVALVMELVEGPTLADRIAGGPLPLDEALPIARQIAEALEAAHDQGIIHRDLKPANIKVRPDGTVKVLDFGPCGRAPVANYSSWGLGRGRGLWRYLFSPEERSWPTRLASCSKGDTQTICRSTTTCRRMTSGS